MQTTRRKTKSDLVESADGKVLKRAQWEAFEFEIEASGLVKVINGSYGEEKDDHTYRVKVEDGLPVACECPHFRYNDDVDLCKHGASLLLREPVLKAAKSQQEAAEKAMIADGGQTLAYTQHIEPPEQGGKKYVRCEGCGRELLVDLGGIDNLSHKEDCEVGH